VPLGVVALVATAGIKESGDADARGLDLAGMAASCAVLGAGTYALIEGAAHGWVSGRVLGAAAVAAVGVPVAAAVERRSRAPLLDLALFADRAVAGGVAAQVLWGSV